MIETVHERRGLLVQIRFEHGRMSLGFIVVTPTKAVLCSGANPIWKRSLTGCIDGIAGDHPNDPETLVIASRNHDSPIVECEEGRAEFLKSGLKREQ